MRTLHGYLLRRVCGALALSVLVFTAVLMLASGMKDLLRQLVTGQVPLAVVVKAFGLLAPYVVTFSLPMGLLASVLLVFGRFSADQEYTAARAGGVSLIAMVAPLLGLGVVVSGLAAYVNLEVAPRCKRLSKDLVHEMVMQFLTEQPGRVLQRDEPIELPGYYIRIGDRKPAAVEGELELEDVLIHFRQGTKLQQRIKAQTGRVRVDAKQSRYVFDLYKVELQSRDLPDPNAAPGEGRERGSGRWYTLSMEEHTNQVVSFAPVERGLRRLKDNELTFNELWRHWQSRGRVVTADAKFGVAVLQYAREEPVFPAPESRLQVMRDGRMVGEVRVSDQRAEGYVNAEVTEGEIQPGDEVRDIGKQVHLHGQFAFSCACLGFVMVGIPLGLRTSRRETTVGIAFAVLLVLVFYSFLLLGRAFVDKPEWHPEWMVWAPAFLFQGVGAILLWKAHRG